MDISIAITCFNEEEFIVDTINSVLMALKRLPFSYEIIVIDDASKDGSVQKIKDWTSRNRDVPLRLIENKVNKGVANNFIDGAFAAQGDYYRLCCGDDAESTETLIRIFKNIGKSDVIIPVQNQSEVLKKTRLRKFISKAVTGLANTISGFNIGYYNGLPIIRRYLVLRFPPITYGFGYQIDILTRLLDEGITYLQVPHIVSIDRKGDKSVAVSLRNILSVIHTFIEIGFRRIRRVMYRNAIPRSKEIIYEI